MRFIRFEREDEAEEWARKKLELSRAPEFFRCLSAVDRDNNFVCVVVLTNFSSRGVDMNIALEGKKMTPKSTVEMFNYIFGFLFEELFIVRATGLTGWDNTKAKKIIQHFGFRLEGVMRKALPEDRDLAVYGFLAEDYRQHNWYRKND